MDIMRQLDSLMKPAVDRERLTTVSSFRVAREREQAQFERKVASRVAILRKVSIFKEMSPEELELAAEAFSEETRAPGSYVMRQGDMGDDFFIVSGGRAIVLHAAAPTYEPGDGQPAKVLAVIEENAWFGELALLTDEPRSATIRADPEAEQPLELLRMVRGDFQRLFAGSASLRNANSNLKERRAWDVLSGLRLFRGLNDDQLRSIIAATTVVTYQPGTYVVQQGREGKNFYVILEGVVKVTVADMTHPRNERPVAELGDRDYFGEVALLASDPRRTANVVTLTQRMAVSRRARDF